MFQYYFQAQISSERVGSSIRFFSRATAHVPGVLANRVEADCPVRFTETFDGLLVISNGINPMLKWDGVMPAAVPMGCPAPLEAMSIAATGTSHGGLTENLTFVFERTAPGAVRFSTN